MDVPNRTLNDTFVVEQAPIPVPSLSHGAILLLIVILGALAIRRVG